MFLMLCNRLTPIRKTTNRTLAFYLALSFVICVSSTPLFAAAPNVTLVSPTPQTITAEPDAVISVTFDTPIDTLTVTASSFKVFGRWSGPSAGVISFTNGQTEIHFTPDDSLFAGEWVTVSLTRAIKSQSGDSLATAYIWNYWIRALKGSLDLFDFGQRSIRLPAETHIQSYGAYAGDLNNDGWSDLAIPNEISADVRIFLNTGTGTYAGFTIRTMPGAVSPSPIEGSDFNLDGEIDVVVGSAGSDVMTVMMGNGSGGFLSPTNYTAGASVRSVGVIDLDGDGDGDILTTNRIGNYITLFRNDGSGVFAAYETLETGVSGETGNVITDVNNDGIPDVIVGGLFSSQFAIMIGDGNGSLTFSSSISVGGSPWMLGVGDVNGDGDADVVSANSSSNNVTVAFGDGAGGFISDTTYLAGLFPIAIDLGDIDGDGDLDMVASCFSGAEFIIFENDGNGVFGNTRSYPSSSAGSCAILHDRDNDGDMDMSAIDEIDDILFLYDNDFREVRISADTLFGPPPFQVSFSATTEKTPLNWLWEFGDGDTSTLAAPTHIYGDPGLCTVTATIQTSDSQFTEIASDYIGVYSDSLLPLDSSFEPGQPVVVTVYGRNFLPVTNMQVPFVWNGGLVFDSASTETLRTSNFVVDVINIDPFGLKAAITLAGAQGDTLPPGTGPVLRLFFAPPSAPSLPSPTLDTATVSVMSHGQYNVSFTSTFGAYSAVGGSSTIGLICCLVPGDADNGGSVDIGDATFIVKYIFQSGDTPPCLEQADAGGGGDVNIGDATYIVKYIFANGPTPVCPPPSP